MKVSIKAQQKGITIIALAVTIIVLLIIAGVSIASLTGENGIITNASKASDDTKKGNYQEELELIGINLQQTSKNLSTEELMEKYEKEIKKDKILKKAKEIAKVENRKPITIQVTTEEGWIYWVTEDEVEYRGLQAERGIYVSLNGNTLSFYDNEEDAYNNKDSEENYIGDISQKIDWTASVSPAIRNLIEKVVIVDEIEPINMNGFFSGLEKVIAIENIDKINTSRVKDMSYLFNSCKRLKTLDLSTFDTSNVTNMARMFSECNIIEKLDLSSFDTSKVTDMSNMFVWCCNLKTLDVSSFDTSNVTNMGGMFNSCSNVKKIDVSGFDTSNVTYMGDMFTCCYAVGELDVAGFETSKVTDMRGMFNCCASVNELDLSNFDTSNVTNMLRMFRRVQKGKNLRFDRI